MSKNRTKFAILGTMLLGAETGYEIRARLEEWVRHFWSESPGQIYPNLDRMVQDGLAKVIENNKARSGRKRIRYRVTDKGRKVFEQWLVSPMTPEPIRNELLLRIFFGETLGLEETLILIEKYEANLRQLQAQYAGGPTDIGQTAENDDQKFFWLLTLDLGNHVLDARLKWCEETKRKILARMRKPSRRAPRKKTKRPAAD